MNISNLLVLTSMLSRKYTEIMQHPVIIIHGDAKNYRTFSHPQKPETYLLEIKNCEVETTLQSWSELDSFNPRAKFWVLTNCDPVNIFAILGKYHVINATIVTNSSALSYNPYKYENAANPETTSSQDRAVLPKFWRNTTITILTKCVVPFVECSFKLSGLETEILALIQRILKFKIRYVIDRSFSFGLKENGSYSNSFGLLQQRRVDMTMGGFRTIGSSQYQDFDFTTNHLQDKLVWVVPQALPMVHWMRIIKTFEMNFWVILFVLTMVVAKIFQKTSEMSKEPSQLFSKFTYVTTFRLLVGENLKKTPLKLEMRILFIFWIYLCMIFNIVFNSNLINVFFGNFLGYQLESFQEIVRSNLDVGLTDDVMHILQRDPNWSTLTSKKEIITCPLGTFCLNRTIYHRNLVGCWAERSIKWRINQSYQKGVHLVDDHLLYFYVVFYFVKGYPMVPQINRAITQLKSAGLIQHIESKSHKMKEPASLVGSKVLSFKRLEGPFYVLMVGWIIATLAFLGELFQYHKEKRKRNTKN